MEWGERTTTSCRSGCNIHTGRFISVKTVSLFMFCMPSGGRGGYPATLQQTGLHPDGKLMRVQCTLLGFCSRLPTDEPLWCPHKKGEKRESKSGSWKFRLRLGSTTKRWLTCRGSGSYGETELCHSSLSLCLSLSPSLCVSKEREGRLSLTFFCFSFKKKKKR